MSSPIPYNVFVNQAELHPSILLSMNSEPYTINSEDYIDDFEPINSDSDTSFLDDFSHASSVSMSESLDNKDHIQDNMLEDNILVDHCSGHIFNYQGDESKMLCIQEKDHHEMGHPYYPSCNTNELWITNLIYTQAQMMVTKADLLLKGIKEKHVVFEGVNFDTVKKYIVP